MSRHPNQKAMTVNTKRVNTGAPAPKASTPVFDDLSDIDTHFDMDQPSRMVGGAGFSLLMTGFSRGGAGIY